MKTPMTMLLALSAVALMGCTEAEDHPGDHTHEAESWAVTAWGEHFEIFAETDPLQAGASAMAFTHVTRLEDFSPLVEGTVSVVLVDAAGRESAFPRAEITRPGIYSIDVAPESAGEFDLIFRIETATGSEEVAAGRVRVGEAHEPGGLIEAAPVTARAEAAKVGAEISFLKEQQWQSAFATSWLETGSLSGSIRGPGRVRPAAGGEALLTSPVGGVVSSRPWPYLGQEVRRGAEVFRLTPRVASGRSVAGLEADVAALEAELIAATQRAERLEGLFEMGATSQRELEEALSRRAMLESRLNAARQNLATVNAGRQGAAPEAETVQVGAPFTGRIARIDVTPGQTIAAELPLGVLVRESPLWVEAALRPEAAAAMGEPTGLDLKPPGGGPLLTFRNDGVRLVSIAPAVDPRTGTLTALFEIEANVDDLPIGMPLDVEILLGGRAEGLVIPETALVDDGGVTVVYLQTGGESFVRAEVEVGARQSGMALVEGLPEGARVVENGGNAIRRATLVSKDVGEGHVH